LKRVEKKGKQNHAARRASADLTDKGVVRIVGFWSAAGRTSPASKGGADGRNCRKRFARRAISASRPRPARIDRAANSTGSSAVVIAKTLVSHD
jgi:hypothetical protein